MDMKRIIGIALLTIGAALLAVVFDSTNAPLERLSDTMTGRYTNKTVWYFTVGLAAALGGSLLATFGVRKQRA
jgi:hypothetical protein